MTDKTKRIILIAAGVLLCAALVVGIVSRLAAVPPPSRTIHPTRKIRL